MASIFSQTWCNSINSQIAADLEESAADAPSSTGLTETSVGTSSTVILIRLRTRTGGEVRGIMELSPRVEPFVRLSPFASGIETAVEMEFPEQILSRISGKAVADWTKDPWVAAMTRVHRGMDVLVELAYRHRYSSPLRRLSMPELV